MTEPSVTVRMDNIHVYYETVSDAVVEGRSLRRNAGRSVQQIHAVKGVSLDLHEGETLGIVGPNGSGKSTLLAAMTGLLPISSGEIWVRSRPSMLGVGAVMRPALSGRRNIVIGGLALGLRLKKVRAIVPEIIAFSGLEASIDLPMRTYSSGMRARLMFSIATSTIPGILLIDEALAVGDAEFYERSQRRIEAIRARAGTVVLVSHNHRELRDSCDRVIWLDQGVLLMDDQPAVTIEAYESRVRDRITERAASAVTTS